MRHSALQTSSHQSGMYLHDGLTAEGAERTSELQSQVLHHLDLAHFHVVTRYKVGQGLGGATGLLSRSPVCVKVVLLLDHSEISSRSVRRGRRHLFHCSASPVMPGAQWSMMNLSCAHHRMSHGTAKLQDAEQDPVYPQSLISFLITLPAFAGESTGLPKPILSISPPVAPPSWQRSSSDSEA